MKKAEHRFLKFILPAKAFSAVEADTRKWQTECPECELARDAWDAGCVLYKAGCNSPATGINSKSLALCPACGKKTMHVIRLKPEHNAWAKNQEKETAQPQD